MASSLGPGRARVVFDEVLWAEDLERASAAARETAHQTRQRLERDGRPSRSCSRCGPTARSDYPTARRSISRLPRASGAWSSDSPWTGPPLPGLRPAPPAQGLSSLERVRARLLPTPRAGAPPRALSKEFLRRHTAATSSRTSTIGMVGVRYLYGAGPTDGEYVDDLETAARRYWPEGRPDDPIDLSFLPIGEEEWATSSASRPRRGLRRGLLLGPRAGGVGRSVHTRDR